MQETLELDRFVASRWRSALQPAASAFSPGVPPAPVGGNGGTNGEPTASKFVGAEGSSDVHNPALAREALDVAEQIINDLPGQ